MGLLDSILGAVIGRAGGSPGLQAAIQVLLGTHGSGLGDLLRRFQQRGYGDVMNSWIGAGRNQPISPDELQEALGRDRVQDLSQQSGLPIQELLALLARYLPEIIDRLTPNGHLQGGSSEPDEDAPSDDRLPPYDETGPTPDEGPATDDDEAIAQARRKLGGDAL